MNNDNEQINSLKRELELIHERYQKLVDVQGELLKQNSLLEERILSIVDNYSNEKSQIEQDLFDAKQQIIHLKETIQELEIEKQRYKDDCNLAVRLLHRKPNEFISSTSNESANDFNQCQQNIIIPTFPPTFVTSLSLPNANHNSSSSSIDINPTTTITNKNLHLAESLFKSNTVHRYPSTHFMCSNCHQTTKCSDVSVQTSFDNPDTTSRIRVVSFTTSDDEFHDNPTTILFEPHNHLHRTLNEYKRGILRRSSTDPESPLNSMPQMHHI